MTTYNVFRTSEEKDLATLAKETIASQIKLILEQKERAQIALSGGKTPSEAYQLLSREPLSWDRVDIFLGDERWVEPNNELSNVRMIRSTLLGSEPGDKGRFYPIPISQSSTPDESAFAYENLIKEICHGNPPVFDLVLLGLGSDGHTASLFPGTDSVQQTNRLVTVGIGNGLERISLTAPVLSASRKVIFLVGGESKQVALKRLLDPSESSERTPARLVQPLSEVIVLADDAALELY